MSVRHITAEDQILILLAMYVPYRYSARSQSTIAKSSGQNNKNGGPVA